jgi:hypothetical protein
MVIELNIILYYMFTDHLIHRSKHIWDHSSSDFPPFRTVYSSREKTERESIFSEYTDKIKELQQQNREAPVKTDTTAFFSALGKFMKNVYGYDDDSLSIIMHPDFIQCTKQFYRDAQIFDNLLKSGEIYQALRNVWIMNGLQLLMGQKVGLSPSIFAYSLLYPYTDNLLDDPSVPENEKLAFNKRLQERLQGKSTMDNTHPEQKISSLIARIEEQFPRTDYSLLHQSLLAIHHAQIRSLDLLGKNHSLSPDEILTISFDKGGSSVLADGFLVSGVLNPMIQQFFFGFGVWLQLADDLQDMKEDLLSGTHTLFTYRKDPEYLVELTNRTFHFGRNVLDEIKFCPAEINIRFKEVILHSIELLMIQYIGLNHSSFPSGYCAEIEQFSPVSFRFLRETRKKGTPAKLKIISQLVDMQL